eukprot:366278-Chlamydomonas_euryale.AAC.23
MGADSAAGGAAAVAAAVSGPPRLVSRSSRRSATRSSLATTASIASPALRFAARPSIRLTARLPSSFRVLLRSNEGIDTTSLRSAGSTLMRTAVQPSPHPSDPHRARASKHLHVCTLVPARAGHSRPS